MYPLVIMFLHMLVVVGSTFKTLLYNSLLRDKLHIVFTEANSMRTGLLRSPLFLLVFLCTGVFLYTGLRTLIGDAYTGSCIAETGEHGECGTLQICIYVGLGFWGLVFPCAYCVFLIFNDFNFENQFMPLYKIFSLDEAEEAPPFLGGLTSVAYSDFVWAGHKLYLEAGVHGVTASGVIAKLNDLKDKEEEKPGTSIFAKMSDGTPRWMADSASLWSWRLRMRHSANKALELRLLLVVISMAFAWTVFAAVGASVYRQLCIPSLEELTPSIGQLSPEFDPHTFNYNIFVDTHIKSAGLEVIAEKKFTATTTFFMPGLSEEPRTEPWIQKSKNVHVPFLVRNALLNRNATQAEELRASRRAPVPIELRVRNAGTTLVYRITIVKLETRVASLTYRYNTSSTVDEVVVHKDVDWEKVMPAEEVAAEKEAFADAETEGAAVYVPDDAKEVEIDMKRELAIFGPTGGTVISGFELANFDAVRKLALCPPISKGVGKGVPDCHKKDSGNSSATRVNLEKSVTALPVELQPNGTDPLRFFVSIIRISNRLINLEMEGAMGALASTGGSWAGMAFLPAFRPLVDRYETFFEVPDRRANDPSDWHTLFIRVLPQGNAQSNWLEADLRKNTPGDEDLELFCRPSDDDDEPLDPTVEEATKDLACGASADEADDPEAGKSTKELIIRAGEKSFRNHFYIRYKYRLSEPKPFTLLMRVMFHENVVDGANASHQEPPQHRTYEVKFLPQAPMRLEFFAPLPKVGSEPVEPPAGVALLALNARSKQRLRLRSMDVDEPEEEKKNFGLPLFLDPPFSSEVISYKAVVPAGSSGPMMIHMTGSHSLWVGSADSPLEGLGRGSALRQEIDIKQQPNCGELDEHLLDAVAATASAGPAPSAAAPMTSGTLCPVSLRIFERRDGFPRSYVIWLQEALPDTLLFVGVLSQQEDGLTNALPLSGFRPEARRANSTFQELEWHWESLAQAAAPAPGTAQPASPAGAPPRGETPAGEEASEGATKRSKSEQPASDEASTEVGTATRGDAKVQTSDTKASDDSDSGAPAESTESISQEDSDAKAGEDLNSILQPAGTANTVPRPTQPPPTAAPRKMDQDSLLPFFLQTASEPDDDLAKLRSRHRKLHESASAQALDSAQASDDSEPLLFAASALPPASDQAPDAPAEAEEPLVAPVVASGAAPAPATAEAPTTLTTTTTTLDPAAWEAGESVPTSTLSILAGSPKTIVTVAWNGDELASGEREGSWTKVKLSGKILAEGCWCDRKQLGNECKDRLREQAPRSFERYYKPNECLLRLDANGVVLHEMEVGLAGAASSAVVERAMEEAADAAEATATLLATNRKGGTTLLSMGKVYPVILPQ
jgi:hypothetical protein